MNYNFELLISPDVYKSLSGSDKNIDDNKLTPIIYKCQFTYIQAKLGTKLYNKILTDKSNDNLSGFYETLYVNYIVPTLVLWISYHAGIELSIQLTNKGLIRPTSEISQVASIEEINKLTTNTSNTAEFYTQRLIDYICENNNKFPEYNTNTGLDEMTPEGTQYDGGGIFFPDSRFRKNNKGSRWHSC